MYSFGKRSKRELATCKQPIRAVMIRAIETGLIDFSIIEGLRPKTIQEEYFANGKTKVEWPNSKHNSTEITPESEAADVAPWINGKTSYKKEHCIFLAGIILSIAQQMGIQIRWGGNWDMDSEPITDQVFQDLVHYELLD